MAARIGVVHHGSTRIRWVTARPEPTLIAARDPCRSPQCVARRASRFVVLGEATDVAKGPDGADVGSGGKAP